MKQNDKKLKTPSLSDLCQENDSQPQDRLNSLIFNNPKASNSFHKKQAGIKEGMYEECVVVL